MEPLPPPTPLIRLSLEGDGRVHVFPHPWNMYDERRDVVEVPSFLYCRVYRAEFRKASTSGKQLITKVVPRNQKTEEPSSQAQ
ncbi:hypothetical protein MTO96_015846 [Rhipicephalus appendiculatus]